MLVALAGADATADTKPRTRAPVEVAIQTPVVHHRPTAKKSGTLVAGFGLETGYPKHDAVFGAVLGATFGVGVHIEDAIAKR